MAGCSQNLFRRDFYDKVERPLFVLTIFGAIEWVFIDRYALISGYVKFMALKGSDFLGVSNEFSYMVSFAGIEVKRMMSTFLSPLALALFFDRADELLFDEIL